MWSIKQTGTTCGKKKKQVQDVVNKTNWYKRWSIFMVGDIVVTVIQDMHVFFYHLPSEAEAFAACLVPV